MTGPARSLSAAAPASDALVERVLTGDEDAWRALAARVHPAALAICRRRGGGAAAGDDLHHDVAARALERLRAGDFAALRRYVATRDEYPEAGFGRWLAVVVGHAFVDALRARPELQRRRLGAARSLVRVEVCPLDGDAAGGGIGVDTAVEVRRVLAWLLDARFPAIQRRALLAWLHGSGPAEIAAELGLADAAEAGRLLHAARQRLRRRFER